MINCKFEEEIVVCSVDDMKSKSEDKGLFVRVGRNEWGDWGSMGDKARTLSLAAAAEGSADHMFDERPCLKHCIYGRERNTVSGY
jgi:hypothetical protein